MKLASCRNSRLRKYFKLSMYEIALRMSAFQECLTCELNFYVFKNLLKLHQKKIKRKFFDNWNVYIEIDLLK